MKSIIQDLDELDDGQIDALMNKLSDLKTKRNQNTEQEKTLSLSDMLTKEQKTIIKSLDKELKKDFIDLALEYDHESMDGFVNEAIGGELKEQEGYLREDEEDIKADIAEMKIAIKIKNEEVKYRQADLVQCKKQIQQLKKSKDLFKKLKKTTK